MREAFSGRTTEAVTRQVPMSALSPAPSKTERDLRFAKSGQGTLFYAARLQYVVNELFQDALDTGFAISRSYAPFVDGKEGAAPSRSS